MTTLTTRHLLASNVLGSSARVMLSPTTIFRSPETRSRLEALPAGRTPQGVKLLVTNCPDTIDPDAIAVAAEKAVADGSVILDQGQCDYAAIARFMAS